MDLTIIYSNEILPDSGLILDTTDTKAARTVPAVHSGVAAANQGKCLFQAGGTIHQTIFLN